MPKNGKLFSRAYLITFNLPSTPLIPKPPGITTPSTSFSSSLQVSGSTQSSEFIHLISVFALCSYPACFIDSTTEIYASESFVYLPAIAILSVFSG